MAFNPNDPLGLGNYSPSSPPPLVMPNFNTTGATDSAAFQNALANMRADTAQAQQMSQTDPMNAANIYTQNYQNDLKQNLGPTQQQLANNQALLNQIKAGESNVSSGGSGSSGSVPWWKQGLAILNMPHAAVDNLIDDLVNGKGLGYGWGDRVFTTDLGKQVGTDQILNDAGWKVDDNSPTWMKALHGTASFLGDMLTDPLTYVTFGAGGFAKSAAIDTVKSALDEGAKVGITRDVMKEGLGKASNSYDVATNAGTKIKQALVDKGVSEPEAEMQAKQAVQNILDTAKQSRVKNQNNLVNFNVPFTNINKNLVNADQLANIPGLGKVGRAFQKTEQPIGDAGGEALNNVLKSTGMHDGDITSFLTNRYGKSLPSQLTTQEFHDAVSAAHAINPDAVEQAVNDAKPLFYNPIAESKTMNPISKSWEVPQFETELTKDPATAAELSKGTLDAMQSLNNGRKFVPDAMGKNAIQRFLGNKAFKAFNPRTLGDTSSSSDFINSAADAIRNADLAKRGAYVKNARIINQLKNETAGLTDADKNAINYLGENAFPNGMTKEQFLAQFDPLKRQQLESIAGRIRGIYDDTSKNEVKAGVLGKDHTLDNYMFHSLNSNKNLSSEDVAAIKDWMKNNNYLGRSMSNKSNIERTGFDNFAQLDDAISGLKSAANTEKNPEQLASIQSRLDQLNGIYDRDPVSALQTRLARSAKATANGNLIQHMKDMGLITKGPKGKFEQFDDKELSQLGIKEKGLFAHPEVKQALQRTNQLFTDKGMNKLAENFDAATNAFKTLAVSYLPSHQYTRWMGNVANATLGGAKASDFKQAAGLLSKLKDGTTLTDAEQKIVDEMDKQGILSVHYTTDFSGDLGGATGKLSKLSNKIGNTKYAKFMNNALNYSDNLSRLALFLRGRQIYTGDASQAANLVKRYLFNYNELTGADQVMRRIVPFWNWTKNNLPLQIMEFMKQPRYYAAYNRIQQGLQGKHPVKDYGQDYLHLFGNYFMNPKLPLEDLTNYGSMSSGLKSIVDGLNPLLKAPIELSQNRSVFTGAPIDATAPAGQMPGAGATLGYLASQIGGAPVSVPKELLSSDPLWLKGMSLTTGKPQNFDPAKILKEQRYLAQQQKAAEKAARKKAALAATGG